MTVSPCRPNFFIYHKELYQFLLTCQENARSRNCTQIVSVSLEIDKINPLAVFTQLARREQINFYYENRIKGEAVVAIDAVARCQSEGTCRFQKAQEFMNSCLASTINFGTVNHPFFEPKFFCSFSFFDKTAPSNYPFPAATVFLPRWQVACRKDCCAFVANLIINAEVNIDKLVQSLWDKIEITRSSEYILNKAKTCQHELIESNGTAAEDFKRAVASSLKDIHSNYLSKIVLAQALDVSSNHPFSLFHSLNNLRSLYPDCYIFSTSNGKGQNFIGASPELLIRVQNQELTTDALAGSAPRGKTATEDADLANRLLSSEKERREHRVVIEFITQHLHKLGIVPHLSPPRLRQLANIQHLWTPIQAKVPAKVHPLEIVAELHPTPAVAGTAREIACTEIRRYESFERGLYAAPLGWVDCQGNSEFIVGIRSALIDGDRARLYAGAGIVVGSNPDQELAEIQLKLQALLKALV